MKGGRNSGLRARRESVEGQQQSKACSVDIFFFAMRDG